MIDPIVEDVRRVSWEHAQRFGFDLDAICDELQSVQETCGHEVVSFPPKVLARKKPPKQQRPRNP